MHTNLLALQLICRLYNIQYKSLQREKDLEYASDDDSNSERPVDCVEVSPLESDVLLNLHYVDDTTLISTENMAAFLKLKEDINLEFRLHINRAKSKMMIVNRPEKFTKITEVEGAEVVNRFTYLGNIVDNFRGCEIKMRHKIQLIKCVVIGRLKECGQTRWLAKR